MKKIIVILSSIFLLVSCHQFKPLEYRKLTEFKFVMFKLNKIEFKTNLIMHNPNSIGIDLIDSDMDIYINDRLLGKTKQIEAIRINRLSDFTMPLDVDVATGSINLSFLKGMWESMQKGKVKVTIKGKCRFNKMAIPFNFPIEYTEFVDLKVPDLF